MIKLSYPFFGKKKLSYPTKVLLGLYVFHLVLLLQFKLSYVQLIQHATQLHQILKMAQDNGHIAVSKRIWEIEMKV